MVVANAVLAEHVIAVARVAEARLELLPDLEGHAVAADDRVTPVARACDGARALQVRQGQLAVEIIELFEALDRARDGLVFVGVALVGRIDAVLHR
jgi:hypothetical protein